MTAVIALLSFFVLLGLLAIPFFLVAAMIRGGLRGRRERAVRRSEIERFD